MTVDEAELAIARAGGGPAPAGAPASNANGSAAGLPSAALVGAPKGICSCLLALPFYWISFLPDLFVMMFDAPLCNLIMTHHLGSG